MGPEFQTIKLFLHFSVHKKKVYLWTWRGSQKAKLSFANPKPRGTCWKCNLELPVLSVSPLEWICLFLARGETIFLASWPAGTAIDRVGNTMAVTQVQGVRWEGEPCESHPSRSCRFPLKKRGKVGIQFISRLISETCSLVGTALEVSQCLICSRLRWKLLCKLQGFQLLRVPPWRALPGFSLEHVRVCLTQTFPAELNAEWGWLGNAASDPTLW